MKVLGTRFNIQAYRGKMRCETTLERGSVQVKTKDSALLLVPGEQAVLTGEGKLSKQKVVFVGTRHGRMGFSCLRTNAWRM